MKTLHTRFHHLKMLLAGLSLSATGAALIAAGKRSTTDSGWLSYIPLTEFGSILIGAGILGIWLDHMFRQEQQALSDQRLRQILHDHAPLMRDAVLDAFAANHQDLARVATADTLDRIITNSLALRLGDEQFASEVWHDIHNQAVMAPERRHDASLNVNLSPLTDTPGYFAVTVRWE